MHIFEEKPQGPSKKEVINEKSSKAELMAYVNDDD